MLARMLADYLGLVRAHRRPLAFGFLLALLSSFGQTYFVALSVPGMRAAFGASDGAVGAAYALATLVSGLMLARAGRVVDRLSPGPCAGLVGAALTLACGAAALAPSLELMALALFLLRFSGQGLMPHVALTATARGFPQDRGKALGVVAIGFAMGEAVFPPLVVALSGLLGWRGIWWLAAVLTAGGTLLALRLAPASAAPVGAVRGGMAADPFWRDRRTWLLLPAILAPPFVITIFFFHQVRLAEELGWSLPVVAAGFTAMAIVRAWAMLQAGPLIDRVGGTRLMPFFLLPLAGAMAVILLGNAGRLSVFAYLIAIGLTSGVSTSLTTVVWAELFGAARLGAIRAAAAGAGITASAVAPALSGLLLDAGLTLRWQAAACLVAILAASALTLPVARARRANP